MSKESAVPTGDLAPQPTLIDMARREAVEALRAIKMGQFNDATAGLTKARGTIGVLAGYIFELIVTVGELRLAAEEVAVRANTPATVKSGKEKLPTGSK